MQRPVQHVTNRNSRPNQAHHKFTALRGTEYFWSVLPVFPGILKLARSYEHEAPILEILSSGYTRYDRNVLNDLDRFPICKHLETSSFNHFV
jgi:hypothetical protein